MDAKSDDPALALALYASSAATVAVVGLRLAGHLTDDHINKLVVNLRVVRALAGREPHLTEHAELLTDMLLSSLRSPSSPGHGSAGMPPGGGETDGS